PAAIPRRRSQLAEPLAPVWTGLNVIPEVFVRVFFFFSSRRRHTRWPRDWSSDVCSSDLVSRSANDRIAQGNRLARPGEDGRNVGDRKSTRLNSSHVASSYAVFCLKKKKSSQHQDYSECITPTRNERRTLPQEQSTECSPD